MCTTRTGDNRVQGPAPPSHRSPTYASIAGSKFQYFRYIFYRVATVAKCAGDLLPRNMDSEKCPRPETLAASSDSNGKASSVESAVLEAYVTQEITIPESHIQTHTCTPSRELKEKDIDTQTLQAASGRSSAETVGLTRRQRRISRFQYGTLCYTLFIIGWNDGSTGPLIPRMREVYHVRKPTSHPPSN